MSVSDQQPAKDFDFKVPFIVPRNADFRVRAVCKTQTSAEVFADVQGYLAIIEVDSGGDGSISVPS